MLNWLTEQIDARPLGLTRIVVGAAAVLKGLLIWGTLIRLTDPAVLRAPAYQWSPDLEQWLVISIVSIWLVAAVLLTLGWRVQFTGTALLIAIGTTLVIDKQTYSNHLYLMGWLVLLLTLAGSGAALNIHRTTRAVTRWPVFLLMMQTSIVYGFSAITKINEDFLTGRVLAAVLRNGVIPFPESLRTPGFLTVVSIGAVFAEVFLAIFLWRPRFRPAAFVIGLALHATITLFMTPTLPLLVFSLEMLALYPLFLDRGPITLTWARTNGRAPAWASRVESLDLLGVVDTRTIDAAVDQPALVLNDVKGSRHDYDAFIGAAEYLVPALWVAPLGRVPGFRWLGSRWFDRMIARASS